MTGLASSESPGIVRTVIDLSRSLGFGVTAEGVERPEQLQALRELGCTAAQGWHFAQAMPPDDAFALLGTDPIW